MSKNLGKWRNLALVNLPIAISLPKLKTQVSNTNSYCKRWWSIISVKYVVRISLQIFCLSCIFPPNVDQISTKKKIDEVTDERIVYTFGVQHHMHSQKKENLLLWFSCSSKNYYQIRIYFLLLLVNYLA